MFELVPYIPSHSTEGPITRVPYDVLIEIFIYCLPRYRLKRRQPDIGIAPMLLCHVCSYWRMIALSTAPLWSHLSYRLTVAAPDNDFLRSDWIVLTYQYEFLLWWKKNQGLRAPSLCLDLDLQYDKLAKCFEHKLGTVGMTALLKYISSALYLKIGDIYWCVLEDRITSGYPITYPNPCTLIKTGGWDGDSKLYHLRLPLLLNRTPSSLRHLYIFHYSFWHISIDPYHWVSLTHISLLDFTIPLDSWFSLIRSVPHLQLGYFDIDILDGHFHMQPTSCTLSKLTTLFVAVHGVQEASLREFPLRALFAGLYLPALLNLSVSELSNYSSWDNHHAITELYAVLESAPNMMTLTLGSFFLSLQYDEKYPTLILPMIEDVEPVWSRAAALTHLRLEVEALWSLDFQNETQMAEERRALIRNIFRNDNRWLDLHAPACPIQTITLVERGELNGPQSYIIGSATKEVILQQAEKAPNVKARFEVILEPAYSTASGAWNEWGPNLPGASRHDYLYYGYGI